jgi:hypothetical protein
MNKNLYVILLDNKKFFIYYTDTTIHDRIIIECVFLFPFVKKYGPTETTKIIEVCWNVDEFDVDKTVKKYMAKYGIDNVRGGSYQKEKLTDIQKAVLKQELEYVTTSDKRPPDPSLKLEEQMRYFFYSQLFNYTKYYDTHEEIQKLHDEIKKQEELYNNTHKKLESLLWINDNNFKENIVYQLDKNVIKKIQQFHTYIIEIQPKVPTTYGERSLKRVEGSTLNGPNRTIIELYHFLMPYFKHFYRIFQENNFDMSDFTQKDINSVFISHPEFIFDPFVYLSKYNSSISFIFTEKKIDEASELCKIFEGICYWCLNRIDEYEFDLKSIPENIKLKSEMVDSVYKFNLRWHQTNNFDKQHYSVEV